MSTSVYSRLEPLLARIARPVQYVGLEVNSQVKDWEAADVRWCLMYPDAYTVGASNQGLGILYEVLNEREGLLAERTYSVWQDLSALMRERGIPQFSWETYRPVRDFDVLGVSLSTELGCTNVLEALDLAGIPLHAKDRTGSDPLVIIGGHCAVNPEPMADFVDAVVLGDGEEAVLEISRVVREWKQAHGGSVGDEAEARTASGAASGSRLDLLLSLAATGKVYVPQLYDVSYADNGTIAAVEPNHEGVPAVVRKWTLTDLDAWPYPKKPLVPVAETVHERYSTEIFRGCLRGCRFCQAGFITRPVRERSIDSIGDMVECGLKATGYEEVGLLSLSTADHSEIGPLTHGLTSRYNGTNVSLSIPSTRIDAFTLDLAEQLSRNGRRSGLTFAPEGGTERMRRVINKNVDEADLLGTVEAAFTEGWRSVKLYFMCGLPTETDDDVMAIGDLARKVIDSGRRISGRRDVTCTISIGAFIPKSHTSFQWAGQCDPDVANQRMRDLKQSIREDKRYGRAIMVKWADALPGQVEGLLARGDRRVGAVIEKVWRDGGLFDGWSEHFSFERWERCAREVLEPQGVSLEWYTSRERERDEILPWDHVSVGMDRDWLWDDWVDSVSEVSVGDCRWDGCTDCGVCPFLGVSIKMGPTGRTL